MTVYSHQGTFYSQIHQGKKSTVPLGCKEEFSVYEEGWAEYGEAIERLKTKVLEEAEKRGVRLQL